MRNTVNIWRYRHLGLWELMEHPSETSVNMRLSTNTCEPIKHPLYQCCTTEKKTSVNTGILGDFQRVRFPSPAVFLYPRNHWRNTVNSMVSGVFCCPLRKEILPKNDIFCVKIVPKLYHGVPNCTKLYQIMKGAGLSACWFQPVYQRMPVYTPCS